MAAPAKRPRRRMRIALVWRAALAAAVLLAALTILLLSRDVMRDWDRLQIDAERARELMARLPSRAEAA